MNEKPLAIGSALAAFVASLCCLGPLLLGGFGLGAALVSTFAPLRPYVLMLSAVLLAGAYYFVYRKPRTDETCDGNTCTPRNPTRRMAKPLLWLATVAVAALALFPFYGGKFLRAAPLAPAVDSNVKLETVELQISGMTCEVCAAVVKAKLLEIPGVFTAEVEYPAGRARIIYNSGKTKPSQLIAAIDATGYQASFESGKTE